MSLIYKALSQVGDKPFYMHGTESPRVAAAVRSYRWRLSSWPWLALAGFAGISLIYVLQGRLATPDEKGGATPNRILRTAGPSQVPEIIADNRSEPGLVPAQETSSNGLEADLAPAQETSGAGFEKPQHVVMPAIAEQLAKQQTKVTHAVQARLETPVPSSVEAPARAGPDVPVREQTGMPLAKNTIRVTLTEPRKLPGKSVTAAKEIPPSPQQSPPKVETRQAAMKRLSREVHMAMASNEDDRIASSLQEMEKLTGPDSPYLLKLQAYWHLTRSENENSTDEIAQVEALLMRVLAQVPDDLDAGLNMAIVEIRKQHYAEARQRLETLVMKYSEDDRARNILRTIPSRL